MNSRFEVPGNHSSPPRGLTLVAYYGSKTPAFHDFLDQVQALSVREGGTAVTPRPSDEVHVTIVGLLDPESSGAPQACGDLHSLCRHLVDKLSNETITVQFGGYDQHLTYALTSRGQSLHQRSAVVTDKQVVVIGWPWLRGHISPILDEVRRDAQRFGYRHKYHRTNADVDVDAYMVVADLEDVPTLEERRALERRLRQWLETHTVIAPLNVEQLSLVEYVDNSLPRATSKRRLLPT